MPTIKVKAIATGYFGDRVRNEGDEFEIPDTHPINAIGNDGQKTVATWFNPTDDGIVEKVLAARAKAEAEAKAKAKGAAKDVKDLV